MLIITNESEFFKFSKKIFDITRTILMVLSVVLISTTIFASTVTVSLAKCNTNENVYCQSVRSIAKLYTDNRCLNDDINSVRKIIESSMNGMTVPVHAQRSDTIPLQAQPQPYRDESNTDQWLDWLPTSKADRPPYEGPLRCGWTDKMLARRNQFKLFSEVNTCSNFRLNVDLDNQDLINRKLESCLQSCESIENLDTSSFGYGSSNSESATSSTSSRSDEARERQLNDLFLSIDKFTTQYCNELVLDENIELDLEAIEEPKEGEVISNNAAKQQTIQEILKEILDRLTQLPTKYINYFILEPFEALKSSLTECKLNLECYKNTINNIINKIYDLFSSLFQGFLNGVGGRFQDELKALLDIPKLLGSVIKKAWDVLSNFGVYINKDQWTGQIPVGIDLDKLTSDLFSPFSELKDTFMAFFNPDSWQTMLYSQAEELMDVLDPNKEFQSQVKNQLEYLGNKMGYLTGEVAITSLKAVIAILTGGTASGTLLSNAANIAKNLATKVPSLKKGFDVMRVAHKQGLQLTNKLDEFKDLRLAVKKIEERLPNSITNNRYTIKAKQLSENLEKIATKSYDSAIESKQKIMSLAKVDKLPKPLQDKINNTIHNKIDYGVCTIRRESKGLVGYNLNQDEVVDSVQSADLSLIASTNNYLPNLKLSQTDKNKKSTNNSNSNSNTNPLNSQYGCVYTTEKPETNLIESVECVRNVNVDKPTSNSTYRDKFVDGYGKWDGGIRKIELESYYFDRAGSRTFKEITKCKDVNHRIPAGELKEYKNAVKQYLGSNGVWDINDPEATELMSPYTNQRVHKLAWTSCRDKNIVSDYDDNNDSKVKLMAKVIESCHKAVECNTQYQSLLKQDPYFIRYRDNFNACKSNYSIYNTLDQSTFDSNTKSYTDNSKRSSLETKLNPIINSVLTDYTKY
ncbi:MAG: hypothetical protein ACRCXZ_02425 [Patescibacteria group bacterium]